jgi:hypothetical protein
MEPTQLSRGEWSTLNPTITAGAQAVDNTLAPNGVTWEEGNNYVFFASVEADANGEIVFNSQAVETYRVPLSGFQVRQISPPEKIQLSITPNAGNAGNFDFTWTGDAAKVYDLVSNTALSTPPGTWPVWQGNENIDGTAPETTILNIPGGGDAVRFFAVVEKDPPPLFLEDFEADNGGFMAIGTPNDWAWGTPNSDNEAGLIVTSGNNESTHCWGTNLGAGGTPSGLVDTNADSILRSPAIDLAAATGARLEFAAAVDAAGGDMVEILVKEVGTDALLATINPFTPEVTLDWGDHGPFDMSAADGRNVYLEFRYQGTDNTYIGLYLDDVRITEAAP